MSYSDKLVDQALRTYERITRRLELVLAEEKKFPPRGRRTTSYSALQGRIGRLRKMQSAAHSRYLRRKKGVTS